MVQVVAFLRAYNQRKKLNPSLKLAAAVPDRDRSFRRPVVVALPAYPKGGGSVQTPSPGFSQTESQELPERVHGLLRALLHNPVPRVL